MGSREHARLYGVLGDPVDHSLSPAMHNAAFAALGLPHLYLRFRVGIAELGEALDEARHLGMGGLNLTVPLKEAALPFLDTLTPEARRIGAVNTLLFRRGRVVGDNTDGRGFVRSLRGKTRIRKAHVVLIGAGGSARAVGAAVVAAGASKVSIANRTPSRAEALADRLRGLGARDVEVLPLPALSTRDLLEDVALVVNTTSAGLSDDRLPVKPSAAPARCLFVDLLYGKRTHFLAAALRARRPAMDGAGMLLHQGAFAFEAWTGRRAPLAAMARALTRSGTAGSVAAARPLETR